RPHFCQLLDLKLRKHGPYALSMITKPPYLCTIVPQQRQQCRSVRGHRLHVERHFVLAEIGFLKAGDVQLQCIRARKLAELLGRYTHLWRNVLEEVFHWAAAGGHKVSDAVAHILEDIRKLLLLDPYSFRANTPPLEFRAVSVCHLRQVLQFLRAVGRRGYHRHTTSDGG